MTSATLWAKHKLNRFLRKYGGLMWTWWHKLGKCVLLNDVSVADEWNVSVEHWWNDADGEKYKCSEMKNKTYPSDK